MKFKSKIARLSIFTVLFLSILWIATPQVYIHKLLNHHHELIKTNGETSVQTEANADCNFDSYNTPLYFTIFKFVNNFIPLKPKQEAFLNSNQPSFNSFVRASDTSRAPPRA